MKVLVIGNGGRENALAWKLSQSSLVTKVYWTSENFITERGVLKGNIQCLPIPPNSYSELAQFAQKNEITLTLVGPDQALADGVVDIFQRQGLKVYGPTAQAAQIETSKSFAKKVMEVAGIPTADYREFTDVDKAQIYLKKASNTQHVVKKDGLALGKGVVVCQNKEQAQEVVKQFMIQDKCPKIIIEECLTGKELSFFAICDGNSFISLGYATDYKRARDDNEGPNTGGMGAYALVEWPSPPLVEHIEKEIVQKLLDEMARRGIPFKGTLFAGLINTSEGIKVLEFNARFGDPETQALLPLVTEDFAQLMANAVEGKLHLRKNRSLQLLAQTSVHVVMAAHGYPGTEGIPVRKGDVISLSNPGENEFIFFAGVKKEQEKLLTSGGRVLGVTALAPDRESARKKAYGLVSKIHFEGMQFRKDIAQ